MIVVVGATGHVGSALVSQLAATGRPVRAVTRRPGSLRVPPGVEVAFGDCEDSASLQLAFRGADRAFLMSAQGTGTATNPTHDLGLADAAQRAGVAHVVKLSVYDGGAHDDVIGAWHRQAEAAVTGSSMNWTLLRPGRFMSNALQWAPMLLRGDTVHIAFAGRPSAPIDPADVAAIACAALTTNDHADRIIQLSGPQVLTPADELRLLGVALNRKLRLVEPSIAETTVRMRAAGVPAAVVEAIVARAHSGLDAAEVLPAVPRILGRGAGDFTQWAHAHASRFTDANAAERS